MNYLLKKLRAVTTLIIFSALLCSSHITVAQVIQNISPTGIEKQEAATGMQYRSYNYTSFTEGKKSNNGKWLEWNGKGYQHHTDFGILPEYAPSANCIEVLGKRTATARYFRDALDTGKVYFQNSYGVINEEINGEWISIHDKLLPYADGSYRTRYSKATVGIDASANSTFLKDEVDSVSFNQWQLFIVYADSTVNAGSPNRAQTTFGDDGAYIKNAYPGIDIEMRVYRGMMKTNFIIKKNMWGKFTKLIFKDHFSGSNPLLLSFQDKRSATAGTGNVTGKMNQKEVVEIGSAFGYVQNLPKENSNRADLEYLLEENVLGVVVHYDWLRRSLELGAAVIDPQVTFSNTLAQASITGSRYNGSCNFTNSCDYNQSVTVGGGVTITGVTFSFDYVANGSTCWMQDGSFRIGTGTCTSPATAGYYWFCNSIGGGTCSGSNINGYADLGACMPAPSSCTPAVIPFTLRFYRSCWGATGCSNVCIGAASPWIMNVIGNQAAPAVTIVASQNPICAGSAVTFTATPTNGGTTPAYQWQVNGSNAGTNLPTFTSSTLTNGDIVKVIMTSNLACAAPTTATSNSITTTVTPGLTPAVSIGITSGAQTICAGTSVTFSATPVNGGTTPVYQWQVNGSNAGTNSPTFTSATLTNGDIVKVIMTSNAGCLASNNPTSNTIAMTVNPTITPSVSIGITSGTQTICAGTSVTFTATPVNGGTTPIYQWQVNGSNAGTNTATFTSATLNNNDVVTVIMTSNAGCLASNNPVSNSITMTVNPTLTPSVSIAITSGAQSTCAGSSVTFTATPTNGGTTPVYQWQVNGSNAGTNTATFTSATLNNNDVVTVIMTSNAGCVASNNPVSNNITMTVNANLTPAVSIAVTSGAQTTCAGASVTFTATPVNGGTAPVYQWQVNGINAGTNSATFTSATLANNDVVTVMMTSNYSCAITNNPVSNSILMSVGNNLTPSVSIAVNGGLQPICAGTSVTFTATPVNGGTAPIYQWQVNGINAGTNAPTFTSATLANNDVVTVIMTSNFGCLSSNNPTSNGITMTVSTNLTPAVSISVTAGAQTICANTSVTFTATPTNGGTTPVYQWQVNGINAGTNAPAFTSATLANGDLVKVIMTSSFGCVVSNNPVSNTITMTVNQNLTPAVSVAITSGAQTICGGTSVTFTATPVNGGTIPVYQWQVNGINAGTNAPTFTSAMLANGDIVTAALTSNEGCLISNNPVSNAITMTVNQNLIPSVSIAITSGTQTICANTSVTFTATPVNGGTAPVYQWQVNGINAGTNSATFTSATLANGDVVTVVLTSNEGCVASNNPVSNAITMTVNPNLTPAVSIAITTGAQTICANTSVTFTATPTNGGTTPLYQWQVNGINAGTNSATFTSATLANGDVVTVVLTSNEGCLTSNNPVSNTITMSVSPNLTPTVSTAITSGSQTICAGTSVTFTATPINGGTAPVYQWNVNGTNQGTNSATFTSATLANADVVTVVLTSNEGCLASNNPVSNPITMTVNPNLTPAVSIAITSGAQTICAGTSVTFTATPANGGTAPVYQWKVNGTNQGTNSATFTSATLANGDVVTVVLTSNETCVASNNPVSNPITMSVSPNLIPTVSIAITSGAQTICAGTGVTFTATPANGGIAPLYQWKVNGINAGTNSATFTSATLANADVVTVVLTSNEGCLASNNPVSNSIAVTVHPNLTPTISIAIPNNTVCVGAFAQFTATITNGGPIPTYQWKVNGVNAGTNSPSFASANLASGDVISCTLTTSVPCYTALNVTSNNIVITIAPVPVLTISGVTEILQGGYAQLNATVSIPNVSYNWTPFESLNNASIPNPVASPDYTTLYKLEATSTANCKGSGTIVVKVVPGPQIANTFSPNNDGIHDFWEIKNLSTYPACRIQVFTRSGQLVFESIGYTKPWDGNYKGKPLPFDTYYYILELNNRIAGKPVTGYVTIIK